MSSSILQPDKPIIKNSKNKKISTFLTKRGFAILKDQLPIITLEKLKKELRVKPFVNRDYGPIPDCFPVYLESNKKIYLPKYFGFKRFGEPHSVKLNEGESRDINFIGELRDKQKPVVDAFIKSCDVTKSYVKASRGGIISVGCGFGKTVLALYLMSYLKKKTLVIVHKEFLVNQWKERCKQYLPNAKIGIIQGNNMDDNDSDIVIGMLQSISMKDYDLDLFNPFGFTVIDECHHIGAEVFSRALTKVNTQFMLGLSATPKRKDGLSKVFEWYIGPYVYMDIKKQDTRQIEIRMLHYNNNNPCYCKDEVIGYNKICIPRMVSNICNFKDRNNFILQLIDYLIQSHSERNILVLSDRLSQLRSISDSLLQNKIYKDCVGFYIGGMKEEALKKSEQCRVILGTYSMSSEGMDIPTLNTLIMASPKSDIEQSIGRILRKQHNICPEVYDIVDCFSIFSNQSNKRKTLYLKKGYPIKTGIISNENNNNYKIGDILKSLQLIENKSKKNIKKTEKKGCLIIED